MASCGACGSAVPEAAGFCPACGASLGDPQERSERKLATLVFADLVGSTRLAGAQDPEETRAVLERFYDAMSAEIAAAGGTVEKFAGDAVMAAFGAPAALEDHAERALHGALAMQRRLDDLAGGELSLRIGVNSGEVVVGQPRSGSSFVSGDPVNVAARLEQGAAAGEILVGERTVALVRGAFEFDEPRTIEAKGKPEGIECRRLLRALSLMRPRGVLGLHPAFVGRDAEMEALSRAYEEVQTGGEPSLVTILGDAGVGKSRIVREFWGRLGTLTPEPMRRTGRCLSYGEGVTYWPLAEVLREHLGLSESEPSASVLEALGSRQMLGLSLGLDVAHGLHPLAARDRFQDEWVGFVEEIAALRPLVILIEDIHWAEDLLLDLLERLVSDARGPLLLLVTARPELLESRPGWGTRLPGTSITLDALSPTDSAQMLDGLLGGGLPAGLRDVVVQRAEGNPFFVEEMLGTLIDLGLLTQTGDSWSLAELPPDFSVPDTVQAVVAARVDLLAEAEKQGLQAASVIGRIFWAGPVYELVMEGEPDLRVIEERDLIRRRHGSAIPGDREYAIKHAVTREVAYSGLPRARRAQMHAAFARWLEDNGLGKDEFVSLLAHHYAEAVKPEDVDIAWEGRGEELADLRGRALAWLRTASELAIGRMEVEDGLALLHRAVELETDPEGLATLWHSIGRANILKYDGEAFWTAMQASLDATGDRSLEAEIYADLASQTALRSGMWMTRPDPGLVQRWIDLALQLAPPGSAERAKALLAKALWGSEPAEAEASAREALGIAETLDDLELLSFALSALAIAATARGDHEAACDLCWKRIDLVPRLSDPDHISLVYGYSEDTFVAAGRLPDAHRMVEVQAEVTRTLSAHHRLHNTYGHVYVDAVTGRWESVRDHTAKMEAAVTANAGTPCVLEDVGLTYCALAQVRLGDDAEAERLRQIVVSLGRKGFEAQASIDLEIALARGDLTEAERILGILSSWENLESVDVASRLNALVALERRDEIESEAPALIAQRSYVEPFALRALGWARGDDELIQRAIDRFEAMGMEWFADQTRSMVDP